MPTRATGRPDVDAGTLAMMTREGTVVGNAAYMSPEQAVGAPVDVRVDVWAFGAMLFEMPSGRRGFPGHTITETPAAVLRAAHRRGGGIDRGLGCGAGFGNRDMADGALPGRLAGGPHRSVASRTALISRLPRGIRRFPGSWRVATRRLVPGRRRCSDSIGRSTAG